MGRRERPSAIARSARLTIQPGRSGRESPAGYSKLRHDRLLHRPMPPIRPSPSSLTTPARVRPRHGIKHFAEHHRPCWHRPSATTPPSRPIRIVTGTLAQPAGSRSAALRRDGRMPRRLSRTRPNATLDGRSSRSRGNHGSPPRASRPFPSEVNRADRSPRTRGGRAAINRSAPAAARVKVVDLAHRPDPSDVTDAPMR